MTSSRLGADGKIMTLFCVKCWLYKKKQVNADFVVAGDSKCWDCFNSEILYLVTKDREK